MQDLKKVRIMTNLAVYDKHNGEEDRKITSFYRRDYIYMKNLGIRFGVVLGSVAILAFYYGYKILVIEENIFDILTVNEFIKMGVFIFALLVIYTIIGTIINGRRYDRAEVNCERYNRMFCKLHDIPNLEDLEEGV